MIAGFYRFLVAQFPAHVQAFFVSVLAAVLLPLAPLGAEFAVNGVVKSDTWAVTAVTFTSAIAVTSRSQFILMLGMAAAGIMAFMYGVELSRIKAQLEVAERGVQLDFALEPNGTPLVAVGMLVAAALIHTVDRVGRHLVEKRPFLEFKTE